jgi:DNA-binding response OmpR family regulator
MPVILVCSATSLDSDLAKTYLWRADVERHLVTRYEDAMREVLEKRPSLILIDRRFPRAADLVSALRRDETTRSTSVVVAARGDFEPAEVDLLEAGVNAILRLPPGPDWDERLMRLLAVPIRREARFAVQFDLEAVHVGESLVGTAMNLSEHGMLIQSPTPLAIGEHIRFAFRLPGAFIDGRGRVVRQAGTGQYGVVFETVDGEGLAQIQRYVKSRS